MNKISVKTILMEDIFYDFKTSTSINDLRRYFANDNLETYKLSKKSKIHVADYSNLRFLFENQSLTTIQINFENKSELLVKDDFFKTLSKIELLDYFSTNGWHIEQILEVIIFTKNKFRLSFNKKDMILGLLTISID